MTEDFKLSGDHTTLSLDRHGRLGVFDNEVGAEGASIQLDEAQLRALSKQADLVAGSLAAQAFADKPLVFLADEKEAFKGRVVRVIDTDIRGGRVRVAIIGEGFSLLVAPDRLRRLA